MAINTEPMQVDIYKSRGYEQSPDSEMPIKFPGCIKQKFVVASLKPEMLSAFFGLSPLFDIVATSEPKSYGWQALVALFTEASKQGNMRLKKVKGRVHLYTQDGVLVSELRNDAIFFKGIFKKNPDFVLRIATEKTDDEIVDLMSNAGFEVCQITYDIEPLWKKD